MGGVSYVPFGEGGSGNPSPVLLAGKDAYAVNNIEDLDPVLYVGKVNPDGAWLIIKYDDTSGVMAYAALNTNPSVDDYAAAWSARATLVYGGFETVSV
jgi:hypothetical protein